MKYAIIVVLLLAAPAAVAWDSGPREVELCWPRHLGATGYCIEMGYPWQNREWKVPNHDSPNWGNVRYTMSDTTGESWRTWEGRLTWTDMVGFRADAYGDEEICYGFRLRPGRWVAVIWAQDKDGATLDSLEVEIIVPLPVTEVKVKVE